MRILCYKCFWVCIHKDFGVCYVVFINGSSIDSLLAFVLRIKHFPQMNIVCSHVSLQISNKELIHRFSDGWMLSWLRALFYCLRSLFFGCLFLCFLHNAECRRGMWFIITLTTLYMNKLNKCSIVFDKLQDLIQQISVSLSCCWYYLGSTMLFHVTHAIAAGNDQIDNHPCKNTIKYFIN